jgi:hypothetical protein
VRRDSVRGLTTAGRLAADDAGPGLTANHPEPKHHAVLDADLASAAVNPQVYLPWPTLVAWRAGMMATPRRQASYELSIIRIQKYAW